MAHCLGGLLAALGQGDPGAVADSLAAAERELAARGSVEGGGGGGREQAFAATLKAWSGGRWREVCACVLQSVSLLCQCSLLYVVAGRGVYARPDRVSSVRKWALLRGICFLCQLF